MRRITRDAGASKAERALELYEKGVSSAAIAERLGVRQGHVQGMLQRARQRREKMAGNLTTEGAD